MNASTSRRLHVLAFALTTVAIVLGLRSVFSSDPGSGLTGMFFVLGAVIVMRIRRRRLEAANE
jgi:hypothetical protein